MASAEQDYVRFVRWLHSQRPQSPEQVLRFANMVLEDFEAVAETAPQRNARSAHLAGVARRVLSTTAPEVPRAAAAEPKLEFPWRRLRSLSVGPFRGFVREEDFDLTKQVVLFYGPNGTGKTSLCEALERALLGSVQEADLKRVEEDLYLVNLYAGRFVEPRLTASDDEGQEVPVVPSADQFRFYFVEKNRIDAFSRIASRPPAQRAELIATLFGMEQFNDFVGRFNDSMDAELKLGNLRQLELKQKRTVLDGDRALVEGEANALAAHDVEDAAYAKGLAPGALVADLRVRIGTAEAPGRLGQLNVLLDAVPARVIDVDRARVVAACQAADKAADDLQGTADELRRRAVQVSFKAMYTAVRDLREPSGDRCPACDTPLDRVVRDPYERAQTGLRDLEELANIEQRHEAQAETLGAASRTLSGLLIRVRDFLGDAGRADTPVARCLRALTTEPQPPCWWRDAREQLSPDEGGQTMWDCILLACDEIEAADKLARLQSTERAALVDERDALQKCQLHLVGRDQTRQGIIDAAAAARRRIEQFDVDNARLIEQAAEEARNNARDAPIKDAYDRFLPYLRQFKNELPRILLSGLNDLAMELYNEFNYRDREEDKLAALHLPLTSGERIEIEFRGAPGRRCDALTVLSEGHIRCLGLAILLAKNIAIKAPLLIFDDAINAIDHEHRGGIRRALFEGDRLADVQVLVTCHSHEFIKDIQNQMPHDRRDDCQEYLLMYHEGDHHPLVHRDIGSANYVSRANVALTRFDSREALSFARKALEMLLNKAWKWLSSHDLGELTVQMDGPTSPPNARSKCQAIRKKLEQSVAFEHASKAPLTEALDVLLGIPANNVWTYLNKGTHEEEDRDDFDPEQVETVIRTLERIDRLNMARRR
jgi:recombinational DNA repair ATPase RecF